MQFKSMIVALFASAALVSASPTPVEVRATAAKPDNAELIQSDIATVSTQLTQLNKTLNTFKPNAVNGITIALKIKQETDAIAATLNKTVMDVRAGANLSSDESYNVASAILNLEPNINSTILNIIAHKPAFTSVGGVADVSQTVEAGLEQQRKLTKQLGAALTPKLASPYGDYAPQITQQIVEIFNKAIQQFKTCTGIICLPPIPSTPGS